MAAPEARRALSKHGLNPAGPVFGLFLQLLPAKGTEEPKVNCREGDAMLSIMVRAMVAF